MALEDASKRKLTEEQRTWMSDEFWPTPSWLIEDRSPERLKNYLAYRKYNLRTRYLELENDFRTAYNNFAENKAVHMDLVTAARIVDLLQIARKGLEDEKVNLLNIESTLGFVERYLIWIFPSTFYS